MTAVTAAPLHLPPAKFATPRTPGLRTMGPRVGVVAQAMGKPLMPWQQYVADVGSELHPVIPGRWRYRIVIVTVPRQAGKTTLMHAVQVDRAVTTPRSQVFYTAQTGKDARARWNDLCTYVEASPLARHAHKRRSAGSESLTFPNGAGIHPFAPTPKSLHGYTPPLVVIDEGWAFDAAEGAALEAAIIPTQQTLVNRQLWIVSTRGDATSEWLDEQIARGRASVEDPRSDIAFFEWSADEDLAARAPTDPETLGFHPALGHTVTLEDLQTAAGGTSPGNFRRSFLNLPTATAEAVADLNAWDDLGPDDPADLGRGPRPGDLVIGYHVAEQRAGGAIWGAWDDNGTPRLVTLATDTGASWMTPALLQLAETFEPLTVAATDTPATRTVTDELVRAGVPVKAVKARDYATHCTDFLGRIKDSRIRHDAGGPEAGDPVRDALAVAGLGPVAGGLAFTERHSRGPIEALQAAVIAAGEVPRSTGIQLF